MNPDRRVVAELLRMMAEARRRGEAFDVAWEGNVRAVLKLVHHRQAAEWATAFLSTSRAWRAAYTRESIRGADALKALPADEL